MSFWTSACKGFVCQPQFEVAAMTPLGAAFLAHWWQHLAKRSGFYCSLARPQANVGSVESQPIYEDDACYRGHLLRIQYDAPPAYFRGTELTWVGEHRNVYINVDEATELDQSGVLSVPMTVAEIPNRWTATLVVPAYCQTILFGVTDGVRFDTNEGQYFRIWPDRFVETVAGKKDASGTGPLLRLYRRTEKGGRIALGDVSAGDAGALERETRRAISPDASKKARSLEDLDHAERAQRIHVSVSADEIAAFRESRARAAELGTALGLSNMQIVEVRAAFQKFAADTNSSSAAVPRARFADLLLELGFDDVVADGRIDTLLADFVGGRDATLDLDTCLRIFHHLDSADEGIVIL